MYIELFIECCGPFVNIVNNLIMMFFDKEVIVFVNSLPEHES